MIIRDLTLRSAASFGSFHLIRLLYDEYMFYLVEHKVAKAIGASPMAVMGEVRDFVINQNLFVDLVPNYGIVSLTICKRYRGSVKNTLREKLRKILWMIMLACQLLGLT